MEKQIKKIFIIVGHSDKKSFNQKLAETYAVGARENFHEVRIVNLGEINFDPILHKGYKEIQELEPDLKMIQENIKWCKHLVVFYPVWWSSMPTLLKGMFDRMWLPGFAYNFHKNGIFWDRLLKGRTATIFTTSDSNQMFLKFIFGDSAKTISRAILWFSGFKTKVKRIYPLKDATSKEKEQWLNKMKKFGAEVY